MSEPANREQIALLEDELADLEEQVDAGELDRDTADALADKYRAEIEFLRATPDGGSSADAGSDAATVGAVRVPRRVSGRVLAGSAIIGIAIVVIGWFAVSNLQDDPTSGAEGVVGDVISGEGVDLSTISNEQMEQVVAENPEVVAMRLALARRYFNDGDFDKALDHYFEVLDREQNPEALANVGWMTYLSNHPDIALGYLEASLQRNPDYLPAKWFIANVYVTLGQPEDALRYLVEVVSSEETPEEVRGVATQLLDQIDAGS